jgi:hypothetical protein
MTSASTDDSRDSHSPFGVLDFLAWDTDKFGRHYRGDDAEKSVRLMRDAGVGFVRFDFLWEDIEPIQGQFSFDKYDRLVDLLFKNGIKVQALLAYNPSWSSGPWNRAPDTVRYGQYANAVVSHFKDRVRHWQIWHEPDSPSFWPPQDQMQRYAALLKHVYPLLKSTDPTCVIHLGGLARSLPGALKHVYERGARDFFDVVNIHPFANPLTPDALHALQFLYQAIRRVMEQHQDVSKPVWFTEIGCPGVPEGTTAANWWLGKNPSESEQASWVSTVYGELPRWEGVEKIFWCFFRETVAHFKSGSDYDGLIRNDFSKKPAFEAYRRAVESHVFSPSKP